MPAVIREAFAEPLIEVHRLDLQGGRPDAGHGFFGAIT